MAHHWEGFDGFLGLLDYPMFVVTAQAADGPAGCLVGFTTQSSIDPPRFLVGISKNNHTFAVAEAATHLGVHLLARDDLELARWFGGRTGDEVDKFAGCRWHPGPAGTPVLDGSPAWFVGAKLDRFDLGDHVGYLLNPVAGQAPDEPQPWVSLTDVADLKPGHEA
ncbi:flavin reductase family protein [Mycolicibacterium neworleansense]|uniref:Oxidoreductase n=1 Tax=Mycolicibacterium neworleansense TaxID=146018 RepID=A0A0H5RTU2_9MYCO|nr:flavin reductase family protein [Mycolicibacterium neworleansense]MCV7360058.1 flavin reductase [Mycolicibacterium neworleansense]CRZ17338.1 oxidoreductase [Mycolicibacterium neworleansense]